jgi:regulator of cell morphogenesis and NO signaling
MTDDPPIHDTAGLTRYIEARYHRRHREQLPRLATMAERVEAVHSGDEDVPEGLSDLLRRLVGEMEVHMKKEELILFPAIRRGGGPGIGAPIAAMRADHADHDRDVGEIRRLTRNLTLPDGACGTWTALYAGLDEFILDLTEHIRLENDALFPPFEHRPVADAGGPETPDR